MKVGTSSKSGKTIFPKVSRKNNPVMSSKDKIMLFYQITAPNGEKYVSRFGSEAECRGWALNAFGSGCSIEPSKVFNEAIGPHPLEAELGDTVRALEAEIKERNGS
mgnify:CR=1 FL=1